MTPGTGKEIVVIDGEIVLGPQEGKCGAKKKQGPGYCSQKSGWGTDHLGVGRCKLHGGATPRNTGTYSTVANVALGDIIERFEQIDNPLDFSKELAAMRGLIYDWIERYGDWRPAFLAWHNSFTPEYQEEYQRCRQDGEPPPDPLYYSGKPRTVMDVADGVRLLEKVAAVAERLDKKSDVIPTSEVYRVMREMGRIVATHVDDPKTLRDIRNGWANMRVREHRG